MMDYLKKGIKKKDPPISKSFYKDCAHNAVAFLCLNLQLAGGYPKL